MKCRMENLKLPSHSNPRIFQYIVVLIELRIIEYYFSMELKHFSSNTFNRQVENVVPVLSRGGGGTPLYKPHSYVPPHRVGFLHRFSLKTGIHFAHFGLESGMAFEGTMECINVLSPNE